MIYNEYNKRPLWQLIIIYLIAGGIIYGVIYYFGLTKKGDYFSSSGRSVQQPQGGAPPTVTPTPSKNIITVKNAGFSPQTITIKAGEKVTWENKSGKTISINSAVHPSHQEYPPLNLGEVRDGESVSLVFEESGTYRYHNHYNPDHFGMVIVE